MNRITIFYRYLDSVKTLPHVGTLDGAREWFERNHAPSSVFVGAILTDDLTEWIKSDR